MKTRKFVACSLFLFVSIGCKARNFNTSVKDANTSVAVEGIVPIAPWSGRLIFPEVRRDDQSVDFEVHTSPNKSLEPANVGGEWTFKVVSLRWVGSPDTRPPGVDVEFTSAVKKWVGEKAGVPGKIPAPWKLNGLKNVGPLESLAANRDLGDMMVRLKDAQFSDSSNTLEIRKAPVQISGSHVAFVKFGESTAPGEVKAFPYLNGGFSTTPMTFSFPLPLSHTSAPKIAQKFRIFGQPIANANIENTKNARPQSTLENIDKSPMNNDGWYVYGFPTPKGEFLIQAVLPRKAVAFAPQAPSSSEAVRGETPNAMAKDWLERHLWDTKRLEENQGKITQTMLPHAAGGHSASWKMGDKFVVLNLFSWFAVNGEAERKSPLRSGHFAIGLGELVEDPFFKGSPSVQIEYKQIYGLNGEQIVAGTMDWSHYLGNVHRGWAYLRPIADLLIKFPPLTNTYADGEFSSAWDVLDSDFERVMSFYRVGSGDGVSVISAANSCAQDSIQSMYLGLSRLFSADEAMAFEEATRLRSAMKSAASPDWVRLENFFMGSETNMKEELFTNLNFVRPDWAKNLKNRNEFVRPKNFVGSLFAGVLSRNSILPRRSHDTMTKVFLENGAEIVALQFHQVGGITPGLSPLSPSKLGSNDGEK
ncbi:MAG: hypothetical protein IOD12_05800 [Silvanigrellales bacterium]|nr:hypothetical protein [Silvanigrellales bacterium]